MRALNRLVLTVGTVVALNACAPAAPPATDTAADEAALKAATLTWLEAYNAGDLRARLAKYHPNVDVAFRGWNDVWLDNDFRKWDISEELAYVRVPMLIVQGEDDQYGTVRQIEIAQDECYCPVDVALLPGVKHNPAREAPDVTLRNVSEFVNRILRGHEAQAAA